MQKATAASGDDEDKTTLESGWEEEEPSTTIEQGEAADRIRSLAPEPRNNLTHVTSTNGSSFDEPTVDDQHGHAALSLILQPMAPARLVITGGNDAGQEVLVRPGKSYTIGRAVDNDVVLTDIAVSRKHFDLRHEAGSWVLVDRGSGNGTLVNGNIEDHPFMLANGDAIEIGNTTFRFDLPNGPARPQSTSEISQIHALDDEEEPSTVAGKPIQPDEIKTPSSDPASRPAPRRQALPRGPTMPPPTPMLPPAPLPRPRSVSVAPASSYPSASTSMAASTVPMPQQASPRTAPNAPTMLGDSMGLPGLPAVMPTTIPGQGPALGAPPQMFNPYQNPQHPQHAQMLSLGAMVPGRDPTALVPPTPYSGMPVATASRSYLAPQLSRRTKLILGGAGLTLFAAIATVAILQSGPKRTVGRPKPPEVKTAPATPIKVVPTRVEPTRVEPTKVEPTKVEPQVTTVTPIKVEPTIAVVPTKVEPPIAVVPTKIEPTKVEPAKLEPIKKEPAKREPTKREAKKEPVKKETVRTERPPPRVAADTGGAKSKAKTTAAKLYESKKFSEAANVLRESAKSLGEDDAKELRSLAGTYAQFGKSYNTGMAPATAAKDAWSALTTAKTFDRDLGRVFADEIQARIGQIAPKAAVAFMAAKDYALAKQAVGVAESTGNQNSTTAGVKSSLEQKAGELFKEAQAMQSSDPDGATQKLKQIQRMVDSKSQWYQRASKALSGSG